MTEQTMTVNGKAPNADEIVDAQIRLIIGIMFRGLLVSSPTVPPATLSCSIAKVTGELISNALAGDLGALLTVRRQVQEAFKDGISKGKLNQPGMPKGNVTKLHA